MYSVTSWKKGSEVPPCRTICMHNNIKVKEFQDSDGQSKSVNTSTCPLMPLLDNLVLVTVTLQAEHNHIHIPPARLIQRLSFVQQSTTLGQ